MPLEVFERVEETAARRIEQAVGLGLFRDPAPLVECARFGEIVGRPARQFRPKRKIEILQVDEESFVESTERLEDDSLREVEDARSRDRPRDSTRGRSRP